MLIIKELKLPHQVLTKGLHIKTILVAALYQAIAFYDFHSEYQLCIEALYLASPDYVAGNPIASAKNLEIWCLRITKE